jgi:tRNA-uridine 2-sulfurtransferase
MSGDLDSSLAVCMLKEQGIRVHGITFVTPFFSPRKAQHAAEQLQVPLLIEDFTTDLIAILKSLRHGFRVGMNPCIDCHIAMLRCAGRGMLNVRQEQA